jgi:hypothetical protein
MSESKGMSVEQFSEAMERADFDSLHAQLDQFGNDALAAIDRLKAQRETLVSALRNLAQNMRDLNHYHTHNSISGADVWTDLECDKHLANADHALKSAGYAEDARPNLRALKQAEE